MQALSCTSFLNHHRTTSTDPRLHFAALIHPSSTLVHFKMTLTTLLRRVLRVNQDANTRTVGITLPSSGSSLQVKCQGCCLVQLLICYSSEGCQPRLCSFWKGGRSESGSGRRTCSCPFPSQHCQNLCIIFLPISTNCLTNCHI